MSTEQHVLIERGGARAEIILNRPERKNAARDYGGDELRRRMLRRG